MLGYNLLFVQDKFMENKHKPLNKHRTLKARRNSDLRYPSIDYTPIIDATSKNQLICITGEKWCR